MSAFRRNKQCRKLPPAAFAALVLVVLLCGSLGAADSTGAGTLNLSEITWRDLDPKKVFPPGHYFHTFDEDSVDVLFKGKVIGKVDYKNQKFKTPWQNSKYLRVIGENQIIGSILQDNPTKQLIDWKENALKRKLEPVVSYKKTGDYKFKGQIGRASCRERVCHRV